MTTQPFDDLLTSIQSAMFEPTTPAELAKHDLATKLHSILSDLDDVTAMAARAETVDLVESERVLIGKINTRAQLIASFLLARQPLTLKLVRGRA